MIKKLFPLLLFSCILNSAGAQDVNWIIREGGASYERSQSIAVDQNNFLYVTGGYNGNSIIGQQSLPVYGDEDIFIAKYDRDGDAEWVVTAGGPNQDLPFSLNIDKDLNVYVTGFYNQTCTFGNTTLTAPENDQIFLVKYDSAGIFQWVRHGGSYNQNWGKTVEIDSDNNIIIAGYIGADATFGDTTISGSNALFIAKYNSNGDLIFAKSGDGYSGINALCTDNNNNMYATGYYRGELVLDSISAHGNLITSFFIAGFNANGKAQWIYDDGGKISGDGTTLLIDHNNDICFTYLFYDSTTIEGNHYVSNGNFDLILGKISKSGNLLWHKHIGGQNLWHDKTIAIDNENNILR